MSDFDDWEEEVLGGRDLTIARLTLAIMALRERDTPGSYVVVYGTATHEAWDELRQAFEGDD